MIRYPLLEKGQTFGVTAPSSGVPIIFDIDCGHVPPQMTFINGAYAEVETQNGRGVVVQHFI